MDCLGDFGRAMNADKEWRDSSKCESGVDADLFRTGTHASEEGLKRLACMCPAGLIW